MFITFIDALVNAMNKGDFIKKAEAAKDAISDSINPIMQAVKDFSEALKPFLQLTTKGKDAKTSDYICLKPGKIKEISKEINNKDWKGVLTFDKIWNGLQDDYRQDNINIEFDIKYVLED